MNWRQKVASRLLDGRTLSRRILNRELESVLGGSRPAVVLDVGGASGVRYRRLVQTERYWTCDLQALHRPAVVGDAHALPVRGGTVDLVLSVQVLEHCRNPAEVVRECHRVLRPGGRLVLSTVLLYELHGSPQDYYRFTETALRELTRDFIRVDVRPLGNRFVAVYDLTVARSVVLNSLAGRLLFLVSTSPSIECPCGFIIDATKAS
jgi:SAM-dependent methyltransferase